MKKILSLLLATVACSTVFAVTAFASTNLSMTVSPEEIKAGETVTVKLEVGEISASSFAAGIAFDKDKFVATSVAGPDAEYPEDIYLLDANGRVGRNFVFPIADPDLEASKNTGRIGATWNGGETEFEAGVIFTVTFVASEDIAAGDVYFNAFESLDSTSNDNDRALDGKEGRDFAIVKSVKVVGDEPEPPVDNNNYGTAGNEFEGKATKYWTVNYEAGAFTGTDVITLKEKDSDKTATINVTTTDDFDIAGAVSFYVYVIGNDIANVYIVE